MCEFTATLLGKRLYWGKVPFPFRTDSAGRKGTDTPRGETLSVSPSPKSPVDALESSAATATLPSYSSSSSYLIVFCFSLPCVYLPLVSVCLSFVYYPSPPLTTHVCLFLLSRDPSPLGPYSLVTAITKFAPTPSSFSPSLNATLFRVHLVLLLLLPLLGRERV